MSNYAVKSDGYWKYRRRVPVEFSDVDKRPFVKVSSRIKIADDPRCIVASSIIDNINGETEIYWQTLADGRVEAAATRFKAAVKKARRHGFAYKSAAELADPEATTTDEIVSRLESLIASGGADKPDDLAALAGGAGDDDIMVSKLCAEYEASQKTALATMADDQVRKWRNPKLRAVANLRKVIDDKLITQLTRSDALAFRTWWQTRVLDTGMKTDTANKDFGALNKMLKTLILERHLPMESPFSGMRFESDGQGQRSAFTADFVQSRILATGALDDLNEQARAVIYLMSETGARLSEACNPVFVLDHEVPHLCIRAQDRKTKTWQSVRDIPLVGVALTVAQAFPDGFPRYRHKGDHLSNLVNKFFENHGLRPTDDHSLYSLRHTFEDRLTAVGVPEKVMAALMGHKYSRPRYGAGPTLQLKKSWLSKIVFSPPEHI